MKRIHENDISNFPTTKYPSVVAKDHIDNKRRFVYLAGKGLFLAVFVGLVFYSIFYILSASISTSNVQSEAFTELYFENYLHLPSEALPNHPYIFQFTLHNLEDKDMEYPYEVYFEVGQDKVILDKATIFVKEGNYKTIQERFASASVLPKGKVVVDLINKNQHIDFLIEGKKG